MSSSIIPISYENHGKKAFKRFTSYAFGGQETVVPLVGAEIGKASVSFPLAFVEQGEETALVGVLGLEPGSNLFVGPQGNWDGPYVPALFRAYPFVLAQAENDRQVLCINEASGLVVDQGAGEPFFDEPGKPSEAVKAIVDFLSKIHENRVATLRASQLIKKYDLLSPWTITIKGDGGPRNVTGLLRLDEMKLGELSDEAFIELRRAGALALAYGQLMSMGHMPMLERLAALRAQMRRQAQAPLPDTLDTIFGAPGSSEEIQIDWSKFKG